VTYEFRKFQVQVNLKTSSKVQSPVEAINQRIKDLKAEQEAIIKVCTQLTQFLRVNALNPVNDDIIEYIQHFIREEQTKKAAGAQNEGVIEGLEKLLADYRQEMKIVQQGMRIAQTPLASDPASTMTSEDIFLLVGTLYRLPINGAKIRAQVDEIKRVQQRFSRNREQIVNLPIQAATSSVMIELERILA
jgi:uncharacterized protein YgbK (DUF1537 family)